MGKHKAKIILACIVATLLIASFFCGGGCGREGDTVDTAVSADTADTTVLDRYHTEAVPDGSPAPVEPQESTVTDESFSVVISIRCDRLTENLQLLHKDKRELVPEDGLILAQTEAVAYEGENVFNVLQRETKRAGVHLEFMNTPIYNSAYIEGIANLYEFDAGELSGWVYKVNDWYPNYGCSRYPLSSGDVIEWQYTCDLGRDLGADGLRGWQKDE